MDSSLFLKYSHLLSKNQTSKETIITHIKNTTGVTLTSSQIEINDKELRLYISSTIKAKLLLKGIHSSLKDIGFTYTP